MADTAIKTIRRDSWTEVAAATGSGYFENTGGDEIWVRESGTLPGPEVVGGHLFKRNQKEVYSTTPGLYARITNIGNTSESQPITITED